MDCLNICGFCHLAWSAPILEPVIECPACGAKLEKHGYQQGYQVVRLFEGELDEPYLFRTVMNRIPSMTGPEDFAAFIDSLQRAFKLEPQTDLVVMRVNRCDSLLRKVHMRNVDGTFTAANFVEKLPPAVESVMLFRDERGNAYTVQCAGALLQGWRAGIGDS